MKKLNYLLILIAIASVIYSIVVVDTDTRLMLLSTAFVCVGAVIDKIVYRVQFLIVASVLFVISVV